MNELAEIILKAGRSGVELALFVLLPVMVVLLTLMRFLEARGILDRIVAFLAPLLSPLGLPGLGVFALLQVLLVSFAAPLATLVMMDRGNISRRHIAATLAMVFAAAQANVTLPMAAMGLDAAMTMFVSLLGGLLAAATTYHVFGRDLPDHMETADKPPPHPQAEDARGLLAVINRAGREAFEISISAMPMLILALVLVYVLRSLGVIDWVEALLAPMFALMNLPESMALPLVSKYIAGGTAMMGVMTDYLQEGLITVEELNRSAGLLISPLDMAGIAILISAGPRVAAVLRPALYGALVGMLFRTLVHLFWF